MQANTDLHVHTYCRACAELRSIFRKIIRNRRAHGTRGKDVLQQFIDARCGDCDCVCVCVCVL